VKSYTANQPLFVPMVYMLERFSVSDTVVIMREAQFQKFGHQARSVLLSAAGEVDIIVPLANRSFKRLDEILVHNKDRWASKFLKTLQSLYGKAAYFKVHFPEVEEMILELASREGLVCADIGEAMIRHAVKAAGLQCDIIASRDLIGARPPDASDWIVAMGKALGADAYIGGGAAMRAYINHQAFNAEGISLLCQEYKMTPYMGIHGEVSSAMVGYLDPLFNGGKDLLCRVSNNAQCL